MYEYKNVYVELAGQLKGELTTDDATREQHSHDASMLEVLPAAIIMPKDSSDLRAIIKFVSRKKLLFPDLSIAARSGGVCMSGGWILAIPLAAGVLFTAGIVLNPAVGAALMSVSTVVVAINARLFRI